jgi:hypothetical protein
MKLPSDLSGEQLAHALARLGFQVTRQTGAPLRPPVGVARTIPTELSTA